MHARGRFALAAVAALATATIAPAAFAEGDPCFNDTDCPGFACGGEVCNWTKVSANPVGDKIFYCQPAGLAPEGADGWCTTDADCKCRTQGAKCLGVYCSFTRPASAEPAPGVGGSASGTAGAPSSSGAATGLPPSEDAVEPAPRLSRACSIGPTPVRPGLARSLFLLGVIVSVARRRRHPARTSSRCASTPPSRT